MKLGTMLVRDGRLTPSQVEEAVARQGRHGGRFGTILVEMRLLDADTLTVYLGLELGIPIATRAALERAKRAAVRLITPHLAERLLCVPLVVQDRQLIVAMRDPHDLMALDELATTTGYRIIPRVAPDVRLHYFVERYYGIPRPDRFRQMGDFVLTGGGVGGAIELPPPPLPGLPPLSSAPVTTPVAPLRAILASSQAAQASVVEDVEAYDELALVLEEDAAEVAENAPRAVPPPLPASLAKPGTAHETKGAGLPLEDALAKLTSATSRAEIADTVLGYARGVFDVGVLCVVREDMALGWKGFGVPDAERIGLLLVPLGVASLFRMSAQKNDVAAGPLSSGALDAHVFKVLGVFPPQHAVVVPCVLRDRVVNLLYGHRDGELPVDEAVLAQLRNVMQATAAAYVRLISLSKKGEA
jgi:hypothetical protein